jgi:hypothetical protein
MLRLGIFFQFCEVEKMGKKFPIWKEDLNCIDKTNLSKTFSKQFTQNKRKN